MLLFHNQRLLKVFSHWAKLEVTAKLFPFNNSVTKVPAEFASFFVQVAKHQCLGHCVCCFCSQWWGEGNVFKRVSLSVIMSVHKGGTHATTYGSVQTCSAWKPPAQPLDQFHYPHRDTSALSPSPHSKFGIPWHVWICSLSNLSKGKQVVGHWLKSLLIILII